VGEESGRKWNQPGSDSHVKHLDACLVDESGQEPHNEASCTRQGMPIQRGSGARCRK
jgi:hypothetical protein